MGLICHLPTFVYTADLTASIRKASLDEVLQSLQTGADLGSTKAVLHPGYITGLAPLVMDHSVTLAMESIVQVAERASRLGITLCIENLFPKYRPFAEPEGFDMVMRAVPGLKLVLDTGHAHMDDASGRRSIDFITRFHDRLDHLHISDNNGILDEHLPMGQGSIDFQAIAQALGQIGYDKTVTLEIFSPDRKDLITSRKRMLKLLAKAMPVGPNEVV
jgi:sugar phosphate isomerase/epimerase